jgi:hypothetical protein
MSRMSLSKTKKWQIFIKVGGLGSKRNVEEYGPMWGLCDNMVMQGVGVVANGGGEWCLVVVGGDLWWLGGFHEWWRIDSVKGKCEGR